MKKKSLIICLLVAVFSLLFAGCEQKVAVENIYFNSPSADGVVLLVGETYTPNVYFSPSYPTNKAYKIISGDDKIISSRNNQITALTAGKTYIKAVADENDLIQDVMLVQVVSKITKLSTPTIAYSAEKQSFTISSASQDGFINGYTIEINGESIAIGNVLEYSLADYDKHLQSSTTTAGLSAYDRDLTVRVKATVPTYTNALEDSNFSQTIKINQASAPKSINVENGILTIQKSNTNNYQVYIDNALVGTSSKSTFDLSVVSKTLANKFVQVGVKTVGKASTGFTAYDSETIVLNVKCIEDLNLSMANSVLSWQAINGVESYAVYLNNEQTPRYTVKTNYFDLKTITNFETLFEPSHNYQISIKPVLNGTKNLIQSANQIATKSFSKLTKPTLTCTNNVLSWNNVQNAVSYQVKVVDQDENIVLNLATANNTIDFASNVFESGKQYTAIVTANFVDGAIAYLSSEQAEYIVQKMPTVSAEIVNYNLVFSASINHQYLIRILDSDKQELYSQTYTANVQEMSISLLDLGLTLQSGEYSIEIKHFGNGSSSIDSAVTNVQFVQLTTVDTANIENGYINVEAGEFNNQHNANIKIELIKDDVVLQTIDNGADLNALNLDAGSYQINVYVLGDNASIFSVLENKLEKVCESLAFSVLPAPTITTKADEPRFTINQVSGAASYNIIENDNVTNVQNLVYNFDLTSGTNIVFVLVAVGNGSTTLNSPISSTYQFARENTPALMFNNLTNALTTDFVGSNYALKLNGHDITTSYSFGSALTSLVEGQNIIEMIVTAQNRNGCIYINSLPQTIEINKHSSDAKFEIVGNKLVITPTKMQDNAILAVEINSSLGSVNFDETDFEAVNPLLALEKLGDSYYLTLLDEKYNPILPETATSFNIKIKFVAGHNAGNDSSATSDFSSNVEIKLAPSTTFDMTVRDKQNISFNSSLSYGYNDYILLVNNKYLLRLDSTAIVDSESQTIKFDVEYIYNNLPADDVQEINSVTIITLNNKTSETELMLSSIGETILIKRANSLNLISSKNNSTEFGNNSVRISFDELATSYDRRFMIKVFNTTDEEINFATLLIDPTPSLSSQYSYTFNLDDYGKNLVGTKSVIAFVQAESSYSFVDENSVTKLVYVFNSVASNQLDYTIVDKPIYSTDGAKIYFELPENVDGVDIFKKTESGLTKLNGNLITSAYDFGLNDGNMTLVVKSVSKTDYGYTNSQISEEIDIVKLTSPSVSIEDGLIVLTIDQTSADLFENTIFDPSQDLATLQGCVIRFVDSIGTTQYLYKGVEGVSLKANKLIVDPTVVLKYGVNSLIKENVKFDVLANGDTGKIFLYSNLVSTDFYGLFAPTSVSLPAVADPSEVKTQTLTWGDTGLNILSNGTNVLAGYTFRLIDANGNEYLSNNNLVYLEYNAEQDNYVETSYPSIITTSSVVFPYGYKNKEGATVPFSSGNYLVQVKSMPKTAVEGYNLCCSGYSTAVKVILLETPILTVNEGVIEWQKIDGATEYVLTFEDVNNSSIKQTVVLSTNKYEFDGFNDYVGNYIVKVKAVSNLNNVVNSITSDTICVHRMPCYTNVNVDDGVLILEANKLFTTAKLSFRNTTTGVVETLTYTNPSYEENISALVNAGYENWTGTNVDTLNIAQKYVINIRDSYLLQLSKGTYSLSVKLIGNTRGDFALVNSASKQEKSISSFTKLAFDPEKENVEDKTWIRVDERGVFTFACPEEFMLGGFNYQFNKKVSGIDYSFYKNTIVYKLIVKINNNPYEMFAVDYKTFIANKSLIDSSLLTEFEDTASLCAMIKYPYLNNRGETKYLYFNVFKNNQINFNLDNFYYYQSKMVANKGSVTLTSNLNTANEHGYYIISLIEGGVFSIDLHILGSDITDVSGVNQAYLSTDLYSSKSFIRYTDNNLKSYISYEYADGTESSTETLNGETGEPTTKITFTYSGDLIFQNKLKKDQNDVAMDYPVYQLEITPIVYYDGGTIDPRPYIYYLYHDATTVEQVANGNPITEFVDKQFVKVQTLEHNDEYLKFEFSKYFVPGNYSIKIRTLAGVGTENLDSRYLLNARVPSTSYPFKRLSNTYLQVNSGKLQFDLAYVLNDKIKTYITDYEFVVKDLNNAGSTSEYNFKINQYSEGVSISNNVLTYVLPETVEATRVDGEQNVIEKISLINGKKFGIKVRAIQTEEKDTGILNATFVKTNDEDKVTNIEKSQGLDYVGIKQGVIVWRVKDEANYNGTVIRIEFEDGRVIEETITKDRTLKKEFDGAEYYYYEISDNEYTCIDGIGKSKINAGNYTIKLLTLGKYDSANDIEILNSNYTDAQDMVRLSKVSPDAIVSNNGVLVWEHVDQAHINQYIVVLTGAKTYTFTTVNPQIDFTITADNYGNLLETGSYSIVIKAVGADYISSMQSNSATGFTKLATVTGATEKDDYISWQAVENAQGYKVTFEWTDSSWAESTSEQTVLATQELKCVAPEQLTGSYTIKIQAVGVDTGKVFNGGVYIFTGSNERPQPVGEIRFDETNLSLYIPIAEDFKTNDKLRISYNIAKYTFNGAGSSLGDSTVEVVEINNGDTNYMQEIEGKIYYVYPLTTAGKYTQLSVSVVRKDSLTSVATPYADIDFNYFASGDGSETTPYGIANASQLLNIKLKPNKHFELVQAINMSSVDMTKQINANGAIIANKFTGVLDGKDFSLFGMTNVDVSNSQVSNFAGISLFRQLENATIENLNIAETDNNPTKFVNTFAQRQTNVLKSSLIAMDSTNATLSNISVVNAIIQLAGNYALLSNAYIAGLVGEAVNTTFEGCIVNLNVEVQADFVSTSGSVYVGGISAYAKGVKVASSVSRATSVSLSVTQNNTNRRFKAIGGVAGYMANNGSTTAEISNATSTISQTTNIYADNFGGLVGDAINVNITGCTVLGAFNHTALETTNLGGLVGQMQGGSIDDCTIKLQFNLSISNSNKLYIGFVAGYVTSNNGTMASISNCKINQTFTNKTQFSSDYKSVELMGIYGGSSQNNYNPTGCTQID